MKYWSKPGIEMKLRFVLDFWSLGARKWRPRVAVLLLKCYVLLYQNEISRFRPERGLGSIRVPIGSCFGIILETKWKQKGS